MPNNKKTSSTKNELLTAYSIEETVKILSQIDDKIVELHECSSEDFLTFNTRLKTYYKQSKIISENASAIFNIIAGKTDHDTFDKLSTFCDTLRAHVVRFEGQIDQSIQILDKVLTQLNLMFVPLRNFRQNFITLKYIDANLRLRHQLDLRRYSDDTEPSVMELVHSVKTTYPVINKNLRRLKQSIKDVLLKLAAIKQVNVYNIDTLLNQIHSSLNLLKAKHEEAIKQLPKLQETTENYYNSISKIVTNLQYHDIIRQKMDHIQKSHQEIINELQQIQSSGEEQSDTQRQAQCFLQIKDIAGMQVAQLIRINKDYQDAIDVITRRLLEIGEDMTSVSSMCLQYASHTHKPDRTHFSEMEEQLKNALIIIRDFSDSVREFTSKTANISTTVRQVSANFDTIKVISLQLRAFCRSMIEEINQSANKEDYQSISDQLTVLSKDVRTMVEQSESLIDQSDKQSSDLQEKINAYYGHIHHGKDLAALSDTIQPIINTFNKSNEKVHKMLLETSQIANEISADSKRSVEQVKYYDFFENVVEDIILELNTINYKLAASHPDSTEEERAANLKLIEALYTVRSERQIHQRFADQNSAPANFFDQEVDKQDNDEDDNIEFF